MQYSNICTLSELKMNDQAIIISIDEKNKKIKRHLLDMGLTKGVKITVKRIAPMGDPIDIELRGYELCVCKSNLMNIKVGVI